MLGTTRANVVDQGPELTSREWIDAGRWLIQNQQVRFVDQGAAQSNLLLHAARQLAGWTLGERAKSRSVEQLFDLGRSLGGRQSEESGHEVDVVVNTQLQIQILAQAPAACRRFAGKHRVDDERPQCRHPGR